MTPKDAWCRGPGPPAGNWLQEPPATLNAAVVAETEPSASTPPNDTTRPPASSKANAACCPTMLLLVVSSTRAHTAVAASCVACMKKNQPTQNGYSRDVAHRPDECAHSHACSSTRASTESCAGHPTCLVDRKLPRARRFPVAVDAEDDEAPRGRHAGDTEAFGVCGGASATDGEPSHPLVRRADCAWVRAHQRCRACRPRSAVAGVGDRSGKVSGRHAAAPAAARITQL